MKLTASHRRIAAVERERTHVILLEEFTIRSVAPLTQETKEALVQLADSIAATQAALLGGRLLELERGLSQQVEFCGKLHSLIKTHRSNASHAFHADLLTPARDARDRLRVFAAILRRMQRTHAAMQAATQGAPLTYNLASSRGSVFHGSR